MKLNRFYLALALAFILAVAPSTAVAANTSNDASLQGGTVVSQSAKKDISGAKVKVWECLGSDGASSLRVNSIVLDGKEIYYDGAPEGNNMSVSFDWIFPSEDVLSEGDAIQVKVTVTKSDKYTGTATGTYIVKDEYFDNRDFSNVPYRGIHLTKSTYHYAGKACKPRVLFFNEKYYSADEFYLPKPKSTEYKISYKNANKVGIATATIIGTGKNYFTGSYSINYKILPPSTAIDKAIAGNKKSAVTWKLPSKPARKHIDGYQIKYGKKTLTVKGRNKSKTVLKNPSKGKFSVCVRTYKKVGGKTYYSKWSKKVTLRP